MGPGLTGRGRLSGKRLFPGGVATSSWKPAGTAPFSSGAIVLGYRPAAE
ncbi:hypothetical protein [Streptosporangium sp. NPDC006930]